MPGTQPIASLVQRGYRDHGERRRERGAQQRPVRLRGDEGDRRDGQGGHDVPQGHGGEKAGGQHTAQVHVWRAFK